MTRSPVSFDLKAIDPVLFDEYANTFSDAAITIERNLRLLGAQPELLSPVAVLFRAFHNLKGDAALCHFEFGIQIAHGIESILMRIRDKKLTYSPALANALLLVLDRLELTVEAINAQRPIDENSLQDLLNSLQDLSESSHSNMDTIATRMIEAVSGFHSPSGIKPAAPLPKPAAVSSDKKDISSDIALFRSIAQQYERRSSLYEGRTERQCRLALAMNELAGCPVDRQQLEAAVYMHDIGMMLLPESLWLKPGKLDDADWQQMRQHPGLGADLLVRIPGWGEASRMIQQHHEMPDGKGYPAGLHDPEICPGAKILAIVDAFEAVMLKHRHRGQNISHLRGAAEINACSSQFSQAWIPPFNQVVRTML